MSKRANFRLLSWPQKVRAIMDIAPDKTVVDLDLDDFGATSAADLAEIFAAIPSTVKTLDLNLNQTIKHSGDELAQAFTTIPCTINTLGLFFKGYCEGLGKDLSQALITLPSTICYLNLSHNNLGNEPVADILQVVKVLPVHLVSLNLSANNLQAKTTAELSAIIQAIPSTIKSIDLTANDLFRSKSLQQRDELLHALTPYEQNGRLNLAHNGEAAFLRALLPVCSMLIQGKLPLEIACNILANLLPEKDNISHKERVHEQVGRIFPNQTIQQFVQRHKLDLEKMIIINTAKYGIKNYLAWAADKTNIAKSRGSESFFVRLGHGQVGCDAAKNLRAKLENCLTPNEAITIINDFLDQPNTRFYTNSLACFLLDELIKLPESPWKNTGRYPQYQPIEHVALIGELAKF
ncbi:leucine-rich repeat-containing protein [Legionella busanensis]|uniref:Leucine-rich repeat-containing protein n=1 Tax=Legionella busanensis TaxID=190655 RepID=A0A378JMG0_9GAMM|nr:hypothetical protein [Legionella busanensis]STX52425.1 leucine-rich repeat-containing protein [Legionella busanensis]